MTHSVGIINLELPVDQIQVIGNANLVNSNHPALKLETVLFTLYYPSTPIATGSVRTPWLQRPLLRTVRGYAAFSQKPTFIMFPILAALFGATNLKGIDNERLVEEEHSNQNLPFVLFSHGLGGTKTTYSEYCTSLAQAGYVVAACEHRDGSAPISILTIPASNDKEDVARTHAIKERIVNYLRIEDIVFPAPHKTLTLNEFRADQLEFRVAEVDAVLKAIARINAGEGDSIERDNLLKPSTSEMGLKHWKNRIDESNLMIAGHSFGGATVMQVLRSNPKQFPFVRAVALDPWVDPIATLEPLPSSPVSSSSSTLIDVVSSIGNEINVPLLVINSEPFSLWTPHFNKVRLILNGIGRTKKSEDGESKRTQKTASWLVTLVGSIHLSFSDFPLALPGRLVQFFVKANRINPQKAMDLSVKASLEFLNQTPEMERTILVGEVLNGDEEGRRAGEGYKREGLNIMATVGDVRLHLRPS